MKPSKRTSKLRRTAQEIKNYRLYKKITAVALSCLAILILIFYLISIMYTRYGSFTVTINKFDQVNYGIALCESRYFNKPTAQLYGKSSEDITNIDGRSLDYIDLGAVDGSDNGNNYLCYTFYCKNTGTEILTLDYAMNIANMTLDIEKAVRLRLITVLPDNNCISVDYARAAGVDENGNSIPEKLPKETIPFYSKYCIMQNKLYNFMPGEMIKYTVVIWLEGNDPECVDNIIGGQFKVDMKFHVVGHSDINKD